MKKIYFASDVHLGNRYSSDPMAAEKRLVRWLDEIKHDAAAVYFLGDVFDYWYEYKYVVPRGHVRFLGKIAELSDLGIEIHLFIGNHDIWMFDYLPQEVGAVIHRKPLDTELLRISRNRLCQNLSAAIHPRWTFGFARRWSLSSRKSGLAAERLAAAQARNIQSLETFAKEYLPTHPDTRFFLFGHLHLMVDKAITDHARLMILGDWMQFYSYAVWDGQLLELKQY